MGAQVQALHFTKSMGQSLLKACFDALRKNKETEKYISLEEELNSVERPKIESLNQVIQEKQEQGHTKSSKKAGEVFCKLANKQIY